MDRNFSAAILEIPRDRIGFAGVGKSEGIGGHDRPYMELSSSPKSGATSLSTQLASVPFWSSKGNSPPSLDPRLDRKEGMIIEYE